MSVRRDLWAREYQSRKGQTITLRDGKTLVVGDRIKDPAYRVSKGKLQPAAVVGYYFPKGLDGIEGIHLESEECMVYVTNSNGSKSAYDYAGGNAGDESGAKDITPQQAGAMMAGDYITATYDGALGDALAQQYAEAFDAYMEHRTTENAIKATDAYYAWRTQYAENNADKEHIANVRFGDEEICDKVVESEGLSPQGAGFKVKEFQRRVRPIVPIAKESKEKNKQKNSRASSPIKTTEDLKKILDEAEARAKSNTEVGKFDVIGEIWEREYEEHKGKRITFRDGSSFITGTEIEVPNSSISRGKSPSKAIVGHYFPKGLDGIEGIHNEPEESMVYLTHSDGSKSVYDYAGGSAGDESGAKDITPQQAGAMMAGDYITAAADGASGDALAQQYADAFDEYMNNRTATNAVKAADAFHTWRRQDAVRNANKDNVANVRFGDEELSDLSRTGS